MPIPQQQPGADPPPPVLTPTLTGAKERFEPVAAILAFLLPGAGHFFLGEPKRAVAIAAGILGLFFGGILIGGIDVIDRQEDTIWFVGQALVGPVAFGADYIHQERLKVVDPNTRRRRSALPGETRDSRGMAAPAAPGQLPPNSKSLGRMNELGTLFATIAGMLNLIMIIDASMFTRRPKSTRRK